MVKVIMGLKGSGKTKKLVDLVQQAAQSEKGAVVCIEKKKNLSTEIPHSVRLIRAQEYGIFGVDMFKGYIAGLYSGNYDITHMFIDSLCRVVPCDGDPSVEEFLDWLDAFSEKNNIKFTVTISADAELATEGVRKYF